MPKAKLKSKTSSNRPAQRRLRVQRVVRPTRCTAKNRIGHHAAGVPDCGAISKQGWGCTKAKGHRGPHIACGVTTHNYDCWPNETSSPMPGQ